MEPKHFESLYPDTARDQEIEKIVGFIKEGGSCQIVGLPGVGRSNILGLLAYNREVRLRHFPKHHGIVHFVMVNFSEIKRRSYSDVMKFLFLCLGNSLRERAMQKEYEKVDGLFKEGLHYNDELVLAQMLKNAVDYLAIEKKLTIVFLFDRFDDYIPQVTDDFFTLLRSLRDRAKYRFSVIFSLSRPLEDVLEPQLMTDFSDFIAGHVVYVPLFDEPSITFRINYLEKLVGKKLSERQKAEILSLTAGHMRLVKVCTESLLADQQFSSQSTPNLSRESQEVAEDSSRQDSNHTLAEFFLAQPTVQAALQSIWRSLTPEEQAHVKKSERGSPASVEDKVCAFLTKVGLLHKEGIAISLFAKALEQKLFQENEARLSYDEATNTIKKGDVTVSDSLTKAEFRLLRYLIQHPDEVVERETIVQTVWRDDATTLGVTEQAIDQLIFRLRRKIEEDPNQPHHIVTIKGRGIKFVP